MVIIGFPDKTYAHTIRWLRELADTLPLHQKMEMLQVLAEFSACLLPYACVFEGEKFEDFLERLDTHPDPTAMKTLLDEARIKRLDGEPHF